MVMKGEVLSETPMEHFEETEQTLIRPDYHHHADLEEPGEDARKLEEPKRPRSVRGRSARRTVVRGNVQVGD